MKTLNPKMRSENEMFDLILNFAKQDERIRLVLLNGSRVDPEATHDIYSDFDIVYFVREIKSFLVDDSWLENVFGKILILQKPDDWFSHPYDFEGNQPFAFLIQFQDGNRIDLTFVDVENMNKFVTDHKDDPGRILLQKEDLTGIKNQDSFTAFTVQLPDEKEFHDTWNEFYWLVPYISKGIFRKEIIYVKAIMENAQYEQLYKMLNWSVATCYQLPIRTGKFSKYLQRFLNAKDYEDLINCYPGADFEDIRKKEINAIQLFDRHSRIVANFLGFPYDREIADRMISFFKLVKD